MNETISPPHGELPPLTVRVAPWTPQESLGLRDAHGIERRATTQGLELSLVPSALGPPAVAALKRLLEAALEEMSGDARVHLFHAGLDLDMRQLADALSGWAVTEIPVHSLVGFDFAALGDVPGTRSQGLAALIGQEVEAWPGDEGQRVTCARMAVRLAHDLLVNGPIAADTDMPAPDTPRGLVTLALRDGTPPVVEIVL